MQETTENKRECKRCSVSLPITDFTRKRSTEFYQNCNFCRDKMKKYTQNQKCEHQRRKSECTICKGGSICTHDIRRRECEICDPAGYLIKKGRSEASNSITAKLNHKNGKYLGCTKQEFKMHLERLFQPGMTWDNYGEWHIDHIIALKKDYPTIEEVLIRLHYSNTQPLWKDDNMEKSVHC